MDNIKLPKPGCLNKIKDVVFNKVGYRFTYDVINGHRIYFTYVPYGKVWAYSNRTKSPNIQIVVKELFFNLDTLSKEKMNQVINSPKKYVPRILENIEEMILDFKLECFENTELKKAEINNICGYNERLMYIEFNVSLDENKNIQINNISKDSNKNLEDLSKILYKKTDEIANDLYMEFINKDKK